MKRRTRRNLLYLTIFIAVWSVPVATFLQPDTPESSQLTYSLAWQWGDASVTDDGWQVTNNLGYTVTLTEGYIVAYETQVTACEHTHGWFDWLSVSTVYAGHGDDSNDSTLSPSIVENITNPQPTLWGTVTLIEPTYCEAFFLVARAASDTLNQPDDSDLSGTSIYLTGTVAAPDSTNTLPFILETHHANGTVQSFMLDNAPVHLALSNQPMEIAIVRSLDTLFDDIDFALDDPDDAAFQVLRNLLNHTQFHVISGDVHRD